jgi:protease I
MRALIISADCFEDSELGEPLRQLHAKGVAVDLAAPHKGIVTGKHGHQVEAGLALDEVDPERYCQLKPNCTKYDQLIGP